MAEIKKITIIGAGCVGNFLAREFHKKGFEITEIVSRNKNNAVSLAKAVNASYNSDNFASLNPDADLYIVAVKDDVLLQLRKQLPKTDKIIVHTSGSMTRDVFKLKSKNYGVIYPLQTILKERKLNIEEIPFFIEASNPQTFNDLEKFVLNFSTKVYPIDEQRRIKLHIAAIFASNFTNYLFKIAADILKREDITMQVLEPLAKETIKKVFEMGPEKAQTGPARRGDCVVLEKHKRIIRHRDRKKLYSLLSNMIRNDFDELKGD